MAVVRVAHFSDIHYTLSPWTDSFASLRGKRLAGTLSYTLAGRGRRFSGCGERIAALLADVDAQGVSHAICSGDITQVSRVDEFAQVAALFGKRLNQPDRYTVIPGNHDRYVPESVSERRFEKDFALLCAGATFPAQKRVAGIRIVALDPCRPTPFTNAAGLCGPRQRQALSEFLAVDTQVPTLVVLHYGLLRHSGKPDRRSHRMVDAAEVQAVLDASEANIIAVLHGHLHNAFTAFTGRRTIIGAGSATDLHLPCGYFVYSIDTDTRTLRASRRRWNGSAYAEVDSAAFNAAIAAHAGALFDSPGQAGV